MKKTKKILKYSFLAFSIWFTIETALTIFVGLKPENTEKKISMLVVFGNTVHEDGSLSNRLKARLDKSIELYQLNYTQKIVVSGGLGKEGHYEAEKMRDYLLSSKIPLANIIVDNQGNTTWQTLENLHLLNDTLQKEQIAFVTQFYHKRRVLLAAKKIGINAECYSADYFEFRDFYALFREFFAINKYRLKVTKG